MTDLQQAYSTYKSFCVDSEAIFKAEFINWEEHWKNRQPNSLRVTAIGALNSCEEIIS